MKEAFDDFLIDTQLNIHTTGRNDKYSDTHRYPYEPTSYSVLEQLVQSGFLNKDDVIFDYGCGMGRVPIYLNHKLGCRAYGIEIMKEFYKKACENKESYEQGAYIEFIQGKAEQYALPEDVTACFFFNPFDIGIMRGVMKQILRSYNINNRRIMLFFYYPQDEYIAFLSSVPELCFVDEIICPDVSASDESRNRVVIFETV